MSSSTSSFLLFFHDTVPDCYHGLPPEETKRLAGEWNDWYDGLAAQGKVEHGHPLLPQGRMVSGNRGERVVDGPFAEAKEAIGGYFLLTVDSLEEATEIAQMCPSLYLGMKVEVREIAAFCPSLNVGGRPRAKEQIASR